MDFNLLDFSPSFIAKVKALAFFVLIVFAVRMLNRFHKTEEKIVKAKK